MPEFTLPPPIEPMLAKAVAEIPVAPGLLYEPKWDGFRSLIFRHGSEVVIQGRLRAGPDPAQTVARWDLTYAFPEVVEFVRCIPAEDFVIDGELIIRRGQALDFEALGMRLRPRHEAGGWKIAQLAGDHPCEFVAFDALASSRSDLRSEAFRARRVALAELLTDAPAQLLLTPQSGDPAVARKWFAELPGAGLEGIMAKAGDQPYAPGKRTMFKVKHRHTADVVVAGWREYSRTDTNGQSVVGSLLLGAYDEAGTLQFLGAAAAFTAAKRASLVELLAPFALPDDPAASHPWQNPAGRAPGGPSRWAGSRRMDYHPVYPDLVCEVAYDQLQSDRFRHVAQFVRWRPDRDPASCTTDQLFRPEPFDLAELFDLS
ncbi:MAG: ATP-dependent DNA ligase [Candidatus Nanopelagicales bacterium]